LIAIQDLLRQKDSQATAIVGTGVSTATPRKVAAISLPQEGNLVDQQLQVTGAYNVDLIDEHQHLWLLVITPNNIVYPQASNGCPGTHRESIPFSLIDNRWSMVISVGGPQDVGRTFQLILVLVDDAGNDFFNTCFDQWCLQNNFPGLSQQQVFR